ncbi:MAG: hypothetical protein J5647_09525 [Spirochaetaceae bacterium]|nr:hypothetical protein [Spirochaetaceae bacterium]
MSDTMKQTNPEVLEKQYLQELDNSIITYLSSFRHIPVQEAMDTYYNSRLCEYIHQGKYDIQYLDYKLLVEEYL